MGTSMRISFRTIAATALTIGCALAFPAHTYAAQAAHAQSGTSATASANTPFATVPAPDNPVADPKAVVVYGNARFTILTPELIRMEWSADGKFEDHASLVFINRRLPVPKIKVDNIRRVADAGADTFVAGSAIFGQPDYRAVIEAMRQELARPAAG